MGGTGYNDHATEPYDKGAALREVERLYRAHSPAKLAGAPSLPGGEATPPPPMVVLYDESLVRCTGYMGACR